MDIIKAKTLLASTIGIASSAFSDGIIFGISYLAIPTLLLEPPKSSKDNNPSNSVAPSTPSTRPSHLARQWAKVFAIGSKAGPAFGIGSAASFLYTWSLLQPQRVVQRRLYLAAAISAVAIVPFTLVFMSRVNNELHRRAQAAEQDSDDESGPTEYAVEGTVESYRTHDLIRYWASLNAIRGLIPLAGAVCAIQAMVI